MNDTDSHEEALEGEIVDEGTGATAATGAAGPAIGGFGPGPVTGGPAGHQQDPPPGEYRRDPPPGAAGVTFTAAGVTEAVKEHRDNAAVTLGSVLVVVGAVLLAGRLSDVVAAGGAALVIGLGFLTWWAFSGNYGLLLPAGVLSGLGAGLMLDEAGFYGNPVALGLGLGFIAIYVLDAVRSRARTSWWPLVPGVVLVLAGLLQNTSGWSALGGLGWPLFLIVIGIVIVGGALSRRRTRS